MAPFLELEVLGMDEFECALRFRASNDRFTGQTDIYALAQTVQAFATALRGFPVDPSDCREFEFGTFNPKWAGGGVRLRFSCIDSRGHAVVKVDLRSDASNSPEESGSASVFVPVEAAAIDSFVRQIKGLGAERGQRIQLGVVNCPDESSLRRLASA
jgi:hypothetical protein